MRVLRSILAAALAAALVVLMMGLPACGGEDVAVSHPDPQPSGVPGLPDATVAAIRGCARRAGHHKGDTFAFQFEAEVTESGRMDRVRLKDSYPRDTGFESCLTDAIERMQVPPFVVQKVLDRAGAVSPESRALIGNPLLLVLLVLDSSVVVEEATFMVAVTIAGTADLIESISKRRRRAKCNKPYLECLKYRNQPEWNRATYGDKKDCLSCLIQCTEQTKDGTWPEDKCPPTEN
jgi:hypothetical protein